MQEQAPDQISDAELSAMIAAGDFQREPSLINKLSSDERRRFLRLQGTSEGRIGPNDPLPDQNPIGPRARAFLTSPLVQPTGTALDNITSPLNLALGGSAAIASGAAGSAVNAGGRLLAGARGMASGAVMPMVKFELIHGALRGAGVPESIASHLAMLGASMRRGAVEPTSEVPASASEVPTGTAAAPSLPSNPTPPSTSQTPRPARGARAAAPTSAPSASAPSGTASPSLEFTPEEIRTAERWAAQGIHPDVIVQRILKSRELTSALGTPTPDEMRRNINRRNETGKWPE